jgi:hypothetical protein
MTIFEDIINRTVPDSLYHYTTSAGLMGIIHSSSIWCTHTQYLNDTREFRHAIDLFIDEINSRVEKRCKGHDFLTEVLTYATDGMEVANVCVTSFSTKRDSLSQWRAYAAAPGGFAIGFSGAQLQSAVSEEGGQLLPCVYDEESQKAIVSELVDVMLRENTLFGASVVIWSCAPIFKHSSFQDEEEWRFITRPVSNHDEKYRFRPGASMLIPYYSLKVAESASELDINEIIIGPTPNPVQSMHSAVSFCHKYGCKTTVINSDVPFRAW